MLLIHCPEQLMHSEVHASDLINMLVKLSARDV